MPAHILPTGAPLTHPLVTVIVPTHNRRDLLEVALDSIQRQSMADFEVLVVDDASTDDTAQFLTDRSRADARIGSLRTPDNLGCNHARNMALDQARGRYVVFVDDDDVALPRLLEATASVLTENPDIDVVTAGYRFIDRAGVEEAGAMRVASTDARISAEAMLRYLYCDWLWLPTSGLAVRATRLERLRFPPLQGSDGDAFLYTQLAASGARFAVVPEPLSLIRRAAGYESMSQDRAQLFRARRRSLTRLREWLDQQDLDGVSQLHRIAWSNHLIKEADYFGGWRGLALAGRAWLHKPFHAPASGYISERVSRRLRRDREARGSGTPSAPAGS